MHNDNEFERAWRAFAAQDARVAPPPALERRVMARVANAQAGSLRITRRRFSPDAASVAAMLVLTCAGVMWSGITRETVSETAGVIDTPAIGVTVMLAAFPAAAVPDRPVPSSKRGAVAGPAPLAVTSLAVLAELPPALMSLGDGPVRASEVLQMVRLRVPRGTLQSLGVVLLEPDASGLIDIDVLVGEDGLARDIRYVSTGQE
jgi:hypothetical protein